MNKKRSRAVIIFISIISILAVIYAVRYTKLTFFNKNLTDDSSDTTKDLPEESDSSSPEESSDNSEKTSEPTSGTGSSQEVKLLFGGNLIISDNLVHNVANDIAITQALKSFITGHDFAMLNLQSAFADPITQNISTNSNKYYYTSSAYILSSLGFSAVSLANDYIMEAGGENALASTLETLKHTEILYAGAGEDFTSASTPILLEQNGKKICIIPSCWNVPDDSWIAKNAVNDTPATPGIFSSRELEAVTEVIKTYKEQCDLVITYTNCGTEDSEEINIYQQYVFHKLADAGADLVIGCFPTVVQGIEYYNGTPIFYSLGNFIAGEAETDEEEEKTVADCLLLSVTLKKDNTISCQVKPCTTSSDSIIQMDNTKVPDFYEKLNQMCEGLQAVVSADTGAVLANEESSPAGEP